MGGWLDVATVAFTWAVRGMAVIVGILFIRFLYRVVTYKEQEADRSGRAKIFHDALEALRAGKKYHLKNPAPFDGSTYKLRLFAEALSGELRHPVSFDEISFGTSGEVIFFTGVEEVVENDDDDVRSDG